MAEVVPFPRKEPDEWVTRAELAARFKVSERTIDRWVNDGMPSELWGRRMRRFPLAQAEAWLRRRAA